MSLLYNVKKNFTPPYCISPKPYEISKLLANLPKGIEYYLPIMKLLSEEDQKINNEQLNMQPMIQKYQQNYANEKNLVSSKQQEMKKLATKQVPVELIDHQYYQILDSKSEQIYCHKKFGSTKC